MIPFERDVEDAVLYMIPARGCLPVAQYYMMNKPQGYLSAKSDAWRPTVMQFFPPETAELLHPVGRLDKDTEGLLLFTDDGMLDRHLLRPERHVEKGYLFRAFGKITEAQFREMEQGVILCGSNTVSKQARAELLRYETIGENAALLPESKRNHFLKNPCRPVTVGRLWLTEGRKHEVKLMVKAVGAHVFSLHRFSIGGLSLDPSLQPGQFRALTQEELTCCLGYDAKTQSGVK